MLIFENSLKQLATLNSYSLLSIQKCSFRRFFFPPAKPDRIHSKIPHHKPPENDAC